MDRQLEHIMEIAGRPHVDIRVLPFAVGVHPGLLGPFLVLDFADAADLPVLYLEHARGTTMFEDDPEVVTPFVEVFLDLERRAAGSEHLAFHVDRARREIATEPDPPWNP